MKLIVVDTETSGLPEHGGKILEIAWMTLLPIDGKYQVTSAYENYIQFTGFIDPHAQASNHIREDQLTAENGAIPLEMALAALLQEIETDTICIAHNVDFDSKFLPDIKKWLCTYRTAKKIWPEAPGHSNQVLRYWLKVTPDFSKAQKQRERSPHQALYDVATTVGILQKMLEKLPIADLALLASTPILLKTITFGKHKGTEFKNIPRDYLEWLSRQSNLDPDVKFTIDSLLRA